MNVVVMGTKSSISNTTLDKNDRLAARVEQYFARYPDGHSTKGRAPDVDSIVLSTNDYLALASDPRIVKAQIDALAAGADNVFMSGVFLSDQSPQRAYERSMADFMHAEDTVLCQSGWCANDGLIQAIADPFTPVYIDIFAHTSLWQGAHSASAKARPFRHNDADSLRATIRRYGPGVIAVDSIYSTHGDVCPIAEFAAIAREEGCLFVVDESHSMGVVGAEGEGLVAALGLADQVDFRTFSLSKAFVGRAGLIAGPAKVLEYLRYESRPAIFSSAVLDFEVAGFAATLDAIRAAGDRRRRLQRNTERLRAGLSALGYDLGDSTTQIVPLIAGPEEQTVALRRAVEARNVIGAVFCAPATPKNGSMLRLSVTSALSDEQIDRVIAVCAEVRDELPSIARRKARAPLRAIA
jgi:CAI-1 autoinducer synthase